MYCFGLWELLHSLRLFSCDIVKYLFIIGGSLPSDINLSRISQANIVGFSRLYCSILETTVGVATFGLEPPIKPGGRKEPAREILNH